MSQAVAKKTTASPKKSTPSPKNSTKTSKKESNTAKKSQRSKSRTRKSRKASKKKGGLFACCSKKQKPKKRSKKKKEVRKVPSLLKSDPKSPKKSVKETPKAAAPPPKGQPPAKVAPKPAGPAPAPAPAAPAVPGHVGQGVGPTTPSPKPVASFSAVTQTDQMVTAPSPLAPPFADTKAFQELVTVSTPRDPKDHRDQKSAEDVAEKKPEGSMQDEEDDPTAAGRKSLAYPTHKFFMTQYVKDECRIRRWVYEDSIPLSMESNMKHMLKEASIRLSHCRNEKERRGEMLKDLNELSRILDAPRHK